MAQYRQLCLFTAPVRWRCASSLKIMCSSPSSFQNMLIMVSANVFRFTWSSAFKKWHSRILYGWNFKSNCISCTLMRCNCNCWACLRTDRRGCWVTARRTRSIFCGVRVVFGLPVAFLFTADAVVLNRLTQLCTKAADGASAIRRISKRAQKRSLFCRPQCNRNWNPHGYATCLQSPILLLSAGLVSE